VTEIDTPATHQPIDAVAERLNDPAVAASLVTLLDNAELLSTLVIGLSGFIERGDVIMDAVAEGVNDLKAAGVERPEGAPSLAELGQVLVQLGAVAPVLARVNESAMVEPETIELLGMLSEAATEGAANARSHPTEVSGVFSAVKTLKDPEVQKGLGFVIEIARSLGRRMG
jgi:hypothetical protein